jgi:hypothetical protein
VFELRIFLGQGAFLLPQLITSSQDIWHQTSDTWFDRTADLRVLLDSGAAPTAYDPNAKYAEGAPSSGNFTPAVWVRGNWLHRQVSAGVNFFNPSANTSVFAKLAVTFGDDIDGSAARPACASAGNSRPYGNSGNCLSAVVSSKPNIRLKFCKAWPAEPFTRLSMAETTMARPSMRLGNTPI